MAVSQFDISLDNTFPRNVTPSQREGKRYYSNPYFNAVKRPDYTVISKSPRSRIQYISIHCPPCTHPMIYCNFFITRIISPNCATTSHFDGELVLCAPLLVAIALIHIKGFFVHSAAVGISSREILYMLTYFLSH